MNNPTYEESDWVSDELGVFLDHFLHPLLLDVLCLVFFQVKNDSGSTANRLTWTPTGECENQCHP